MAGSDGQCCVSVSFGLGFMRCYERAGERGVQATSAAPKAPTDGQTDGRLDRQQSLHMPAPAKRPKTLMLTNGKSVLPSIATAVGHDQALAGSAKCLNAREAKGDSEAAICVDTEAVQREGANVVDARGSCSLGTAVVRKCGAVCDASVDSNGTSKRRRTLTLPGWSNGSASDRSSSSTEKIWTAPVFPRAWPLASRVRIGVSRPFEVSLHKRPRR